MIVPEYRVAVLVDKTLSWNKQRGKMQSPPNRCETFWVLGVQEKYSLQMEVQQERIRAEGAQGFLVDANSKVENL